MRSLFERSQDLLRLKATWRYLIALFLVGGFILPMLAASSWVYSLQLTLGLTPGAPAASEPGSLLFLVVTIVGVLVLGLLGMALGALVLSLVLAATTPMTFRESFRAVFLSHYPHEWFSA